MEKRVLLIAGGGTLGTYVSEELLRLGCRVDVLCLEDKVSHDERLRFFKGYATLESLQELFKEQRYDGIVNFLHFPNADDYPPMHRLLVENTDHLIFLSSYRIYADLQHPVTETAPTLLDVTEDQLFLEVEDYALAKARAEKFLRSQPGKINWTIVRPVISFSARRFDVVVRSRQYVLEKAKAGEVIYMPEKARNLTAGLDWSGNTGKIIANLLFKEETKGEAYTISSGQNLTWGEVADIYTELLGAKFEWIDTDEYIRDHHNPKKIWILIYDRLFDRKIDNSKVLKATGLKKEDFATIREGLVKELAIYEASLKAADTQ